MLRFLFFVFTLSASPTFAGYHDAFDQGIDQYAKKQGFEYFNDYLAKRTACAILIIDSQNTKTEQKVDKAFWRIRLCTFKNGAAHYKGEGTSFYLSKE